MSENANSLWFKKQRLVELLAASFPHLNEWQTEDAAHNIFSAWSTAKWYERAEKDFKKPEVDQETLRKVAAQIKRASAGIDHLGWHGQRALGSQWREVRALIGQEASNERLVDTNDQLKAHLHTLAVLINSVAQDIDTNAKTPSFIFELEKERGAPRDDLARQVAETIDDKFISIVGKRISYTSDPDTAKKDGPLIQFMSKVFAILEVQSSAKERVLELRLG